KSKQQDQPSAKLSKSPTSLAESTVVKSGCLQPKQSSDSTIDDSQILSSTTVLDKSSTSETGSIEKGVAIEVDKSKQALKEPTNESISEAEVTTVPKETPSSTTNVNMSASLDKSKTNYDSDVSQTALV